MFNVLKPFIYSFLQFSKHFFSNIYQTAGNYNLLLNCQLYKFLHLLEPSFLQTVLTVFKDAMLAILLYYLQTDLSPTMQLLHLLPLLVQ